MSGIPAAVKRLRQILAGGSPQAVRRAGEQTALLLAAIENLFSSGKVDPATLTPSSNRAYEELKRIQPARQRRQSRPACKLKLNGGTLLNLNAAIDQVQVSLAEAATGKLSLDQAAEHIWSLAAEVEALCQKVGIRPEALNPTSRQRYHWLVFLSKAENLSRHIEALQRFSIAAQNLKHVKTGSLSVHLACQQPTYRYQRIVSSTTIYLNEGFIDAPQDVFKALIAVASGSRSQSARRAIAAYTTGSDYLAITRFLVGQPAAADPASDTQRLVALFDRLNTRYFQGELARPHLQWSTRSSRRVLGTYAPASDTIVISKALQGADTPACLLEFVLYHEMLHKDLGIRLAGSTRRVHTCEFRRREAQFAEFERAKACMNSAGLPLKSIA